MLALLAAAALADPIWIHPIEAYTTDLEAQPGPTVWSPDGKWLAVRLETAAGPSAWGFAPMTSVLPARLTAPPPVGASSIGSPLDWSTGSAAWAGGEALLFAASATTGGGWTVWLAQTTGAVPNPVIVDLSGRLDAPSVPANESAIAFARSSEGPADIWIWARGAGPSKALTTTDVAERDPAFRDDGRAIAFVRADPGGDQVVVADVRIAREYATPTPPAPTKKKKKKDEPAVAPPEPMFTGWAFEAAEERPPVALPAPIGRLAWVGETLVWFAEVAPQFWRIQRLEADGSIGVVADGVRGAADAAPAVAGKWVAWTTPDDRLFVSTIHGDPTLEIATGLTELGIPSLGLRDGRLYAAVSARHDTARTLYVLDLTEALPK